MTYHYDDAHGAWCLHLSTLRLLADTHADCAIRAANNNLDPYTPPRRDAP